MEERKIIALNRRARHEYHIEEVFEAGIVLRGTEVKSLRAGKANLKDAHGEVKGGEVLLLGCHISPYQAASRANHDPLRPRALLLHKRQIRYLVGKVAEKGWTLVPLSLYFKGPRAKVELALARGKKLYDKREEERRKIAERETSAALKQRRL
ncbi:MAG: SsrA-binding protein SmpB [candidate division NC10 bacterium]|nr:SsrA-binding protein SmpB [candidate division NC10 bacterium]